MNDGRETAKPASMSANAVEAIGLRRLSRQGKFLIPYLQPGLSVLDCGCGPGSISCDIAEAVKPGLVVGIDLSPDLIVAALARAVSSRIHNVSFDVASVYSLPFTGETFDVVLAHAMFQHLSEPRRALAEISRVLKPGGLVALRSPDWGALFIAPRRPDVLSAIDQFLKVYYADGDAFAGSSALNYLQDAGFVEARFTASVEQELPQALGEFAASKIEDAGFIVAAEELRWWAKRPEALFAQGWGEAIGRKPQ